MGFLTPSQVNRKMIQAVVPDNSGPGTGGGTTSIQIADVVVLGGFIAHTDALDHYVELELVDPTGLVTVVGSAVVPAVVGPADVSVLSLTDPAGNVNLLGLVLPSGWLLGARFQPAIVSGSIYGYVTLGAV